MCVVGWVDVCVCVGGGRDYHGFLHFKKKNIKKCLEALFSLALETWLDNLIIDLLGTRNNPNFFCTCY